MEDAQMLASSIVFENRPIHILATNREGLDALGVRKDSRRDGEIRIIDIEGCDRSPCGGTHVRNTGEIGLIFILGFERYKGGTRVEFAAGGRALKALHKDHEIISKLARFYSVTPDRLPALAERLAHERISLNRENETLREKMLEAEAEELIYNGTKTRHGLLVSRVFADRKLEAIKTLAMKLTANDGVVAVLGIADSCQFVVSRSQDLHDNCSEVIKKIASELGGKGGGRPEMAQAGGFAPDAFDKWKTALEKYFSS